MVICIPNLFLYTGRKQIVLAPFVFVSSPTSVSMLTIFFMQTQDFFVLSMVVASITGDAWVLFLYGIWGFVANEVEITIRWIKDKDYEWAVVSSSALVEAELAAATPDYQRCPFKQYFGL